jgi:hypothetical protein
MEISLEFKIEEAITLTDVFHQRPRATYATYARTFRASVVCAAMLHLKSIRLANTSEL